MKALILSIKPEYVNRILNGEKKYEYRKRLAREKVRKIYIYCTSPIMKVVGTVEVLDYIKSSPSRLWEETKRNAGISREKYRKYFHGCKTAYAYKLGETTTFETPLDIHAFGISTAPQSFVYVDEITVHTNGNF